MSVLIHRWALLVGQLKVIAFPALELFGRWGGWDGQPWQDCLAHAAAETEPLHAALKRSGALGAGQVSFIFIVWLFESDMYDFCQRHLSYSVLFLQALVFFFALFLAEAPLIVDMISWTLLRHNEFLDTQVDILNVSMSESQLMVVQSCNNWCNTPKFNIAPENLQFQNESSLPSIVFQGRTVVKLRGCIPVLLTGNLWITSPSGSGASWRKWSLHEWYADAISLSQETSAIGWSGKFSSSYGFHNASSSCIDIPEALTTNCGLWGFFHLRGEGEDTWIGNCLTFSWYQWRPWNFPPSTKCIFWISSKPTRDRSTHQSLHTFRYAGND